ncbi:MAG: DUF3560 domain-containing protein [Oscillospiraceae bacterium]|nr:DUF3560 domain-containing protein [Oscillospiraceae bacterium]
MNDYEQKKQNRIDRYREKADKARAQSDALFKQSEDMASVIPFGQPIHGAADRRYREKIGAKMDQSLAASQKADYYEQKAEAAERNTAISSDDPDAIQKLTEKLEERQTLQTYMKNVNAYYRKYGTCRGMDGITDEQADKFDADVKSGLSWGMPFPQYMLSNNNQEIHRIQNRLRRLKEAREDGYTGWEFDGGKVVANQEDNRLQIFFDDIPDASVRSDLKGRGFRWARSIGAWQRQLTYAAVCAASCIEAIKPIDGSDPRSFQPQNQKKSGPTR